MIFSNGFSPFTVLRTISMVGGAWICLITPTKAEPPFSIDIKPVSCIVKKDKDFCDKQLVLEWHTEQSLNLCIKKEQEILFCQESQGNGRKELQLKLADTTTFYAYVDGNNTPAQTLTVYVMNDESARMRKRYRHPWSIF